MTIQKVCLLLLLVTACKPSIPVYHGYVYDRATGRPLKDVKIADVTGTGVTATDEKGHYSLQGRAGFSTDLSFGLEGYHTDTLPDTDLQHGEFEMHFFRGDTIYLTPLPKE